MNLARHCHTTLTTILLGLACNQIVGDDRTAADILPDSVAIFAELATSDSILKHPLRERIFGNEVVKEILRTPDVLKLRGGITIAELALGNTLENIAEKLSARGLALAVDADSGGAILLAHSESKEAAAEFVSKLVALARKNEAKDKTGGAMREAEYRGYSVYEINKTAFAVVDDWLLVTNKKPLGKLVLDRYLDRKTGSLAENDSFKQALGERPTHLTAGKQQLEVMWSWANLPVLRKAGLTSKLASAVSNNPAAELIIGGLLDSVEQSAYISSSILASDQSLQLSIAMPHKTEWISSPREYFFGPKGQGRAEPLIEFPGTLLSISTYRDVSAMWIRAGDLFSADVNENLAQADSTLATLFSGRDFGEDILGAIKPELRLIVKRQSIVDGVPRPAIQLPSFALVAELREPETMQRELKRIFQSLIGFLNVAGAANGQPQFDLDSEKTKSSTLVTATYVPEADRENDLEAPIQFNFSPCLAFEGNYAVLSSSVELARETTEFLHVSRIGTQSPSTISHNTEMSIQAGAVSELLEANRRQLIAQNILNKGYSKEKAETELKLLLQVIGLLQSARLTLDVEKELAVKIDIDLK